MQTYTMKLHSKSFRKIKEGSKSIELRLYDDKRKKIELGDWIVFQKEPECKETITVEVVGLVRYANFSYLIDDFAPEVYLGHKSKADALKEVLNFYSAEEQERFGVLGIRFRVV